MSAKTKDIAKYSPSKYSGKSVAQTASASGYLATDGRAFHVNDYRRAAQMLQGMRRDQRGKSKNAQQQGRVDMLAAAMAAVFEADSHEFGVPFSAGYFVAGTQ